MSRWFRFYADAMRNPKVLRLSDKDFRLWVGLMAIASENGGKNPHDNDLKLVLGMRLDHLKGGLNRLIRGGLIDAIDDGYEPHQWNKYQYKSDTSTDRVQKHREKRNVSVTPPDTETDTEVIAPNGAIVRAKADRYHRLPENWKPEKPLPLKTQAKVAQWPDGEIDDQLEAMRRWAANASNDRGKGRKLDWHLAWINWLERHDDDRRQQPDIRKVRPEPAMALKRIAEAELAAEGSSSHQEFGFGTGLALPDYLTN